MKIIEFKNFSCYYKQKKEYIKAIDEISFSIDSGEFVVVIGESGSGKTTLLKACLGLANYFEGDLIINGLSVENLDLKSGNYAYVRQEIGLYPNLTVYENIAFPLRVIKTAQAEVDERVKKIAKRVGVEMLLTRKPRQLSGGQHQRIAIARALVKNPRIIYFDEPFSNVDPTLRSDLRLMVKQIHKVYKPTILFVTHDLGEAFTLADRIIVLENGKVVEEGTPEYLEKNGQSELIKEFFKR